MRHRIGWTFTGFNQHTDLDQLSMVALENLNTESVCGSAETQRIPYSLRKSAA